jgi:hypothetical protein
MARSVLAKGSCIPLVMALLSLSPQAVHGQRGGRGGGAANGTAAPPGSATRDTTSGFVIRDKNILTYCADCHARDSAGYMQRISYERKTPEGWEMSVRRMVSLNKLAIEPAAARAIVRYLADRQGLAPAELRPGRFEVERRMIEYRYTADPRTETTCRACHSMGRVITQRRTRGEWELLVATHRSLYPDADFQAFRRGGPATTDSGVPVPHPMDAAINHLARAFPLRTPEWAAWSATMRTPHLEGSWLLSGSEPGRGAFVGHVTIARGSSDGEFTTQASYRYTDGGAVVHRTGKSIVYTGYQWRGRSIDPALRARDTWAFAKSCSPSRAGRRCQAVGSPAGMRSSGWTSRSRSSERILSLSPPLPARFALAPRARRSRSSAPTCPTRCPPRPSTSGRALQ